MSVLSVSPSVSGGGAERVALALHERYLAQGLDSWLAVANVNAEAPHVLRIPVDAGRGAWARAWLSASRTIDRDAARGSVRWRAARAMRLAAEPGRVARVLHGHEDFDFPGTARLLELPPRRPDVLHLHNLHGSYFDVRALPALSRAVPTVLTLHDAWLFTGHCAHPFECTRWQQGCGECPALDRYVPILGDRSAANAAEKREALLGSRLGIAAPSRWLLEMAEQRGVLGAEREGRVIPNGVDTDIFTPGDRGAARAALGLPDNRLVVAMAARDVRSNPYKGYYTLAEAVRRLPDELARRMTVLLIGDAGDAGRLGAAEVLPLRFAADPRTLAEWYRAADVLVHPALAEAFGLTVVEAMACGVPVIATRVGGVPEVVRDGVDGLLVDPAEPQVLAATLQGLLGDEALRERFAAAGVRRVVERFSLAGQVDAYRSWYAELLERFHDEDGVR